MGSKLLSVMRLRAKNDFNIDRSGVSLDKQKKKRIKELVRERALDLSNIKDKIDSNNLVYLYSTGKNNTKDFGNYQMSMKLFEDLKDSKIDRREVLKNQSRLKSDLRETKIGSKNQQIKKKKKKKTMKDVSNLFDLRERIITLIRDYSLLLSEAKYKTKYKVGLKISPPKQMLQRIPIALAQVKTVNNSESLLNENRQTVYSFYQSKEITENV